MEIIVQGKGIEYFTPNEIIISINFYTKGSNYAEVLNSGVMSVQNFVNNILLPNNFNEKDMKTRKFVVREEQKYDNMTRQYSFDGFSFCQLASIKFDYDKDKLANIMEQLSKMDNAPQYHIDFGIKDEKECKKQILAKAYKDAELQAQAIADASGKTLKQCEKVDFKPFTTTYVSQTKFDGNMMYANAEKASTATTIMNTFSPEDIELSETLYCLWIAE